MGASTPVAASLMSANWKKSGIRMSCIGINRPLTNTV